MPILQEIKLDKLVELESVDEAYHDIMESNKLYIQNSDSGVSICSNDGGRIDIYHTMLLRSKATDNSVTISAYLKFTEMCSVTVLNHKRHDLLITPYAHKPIITDVLELQFTGHLSGIVVPTSEKGLEVLRSKLNDVDLSHTHGYRMSVFAYNLNTHRVIIQGGCSR